MVRLCVLSDIHGNLHALEAVLDDVRSAGGDMLVVDGRRLPWREGARHHIETASGRGRMGEAVR